MIDIDDDIADGNATKIPHVKYKDDAFVSSTSAISLHFLNMSIALHNLMTKLDHYITTFYVPSERFHVCTSKLNRKENGLDERKSFVETLPAGLDVWVSFEEELANAFKEFNNSICIIMERNGASVLVILVNLQMIM